MDPVSSIPEGFELDQTAPQAAAQTAIPEGFSLDETTQHPDVPHGFELDDEKYGSLPQQALTAVEGAGEGFAGPLGPIIENELSSMGVPGLTKEDQAGRAETNPLTHGAAEAGGLYGGLATGVGEAGLIAKAVPEFAAAGKVGSAILKGALENGLIQSGSELSKAILGQGDPETPVASALAHIGAAGLFGGITSGVFKGTGASLRVIDNAKAGTKMQDFLAGIGDSVTPGKFFPEGSSPSKLYDMGKNFVGSLRDKAEGIATSAAAAKAAAAAGPAFIPAYEAAKKAMAPAVEKILDRPMTAATEKIVYPVVLKMLGTGETSGLFDAIDHASDISRGMSKINTAVGNMFKLGSQRVVDEVANDRDREKIKNFIEKGGVGQQIQEQVQKDAQAPEPQAFAEGGEVKPVLQGSDVISKHFPEQAMMMAAAKGRISNYLNSLRPQKNHAKLPYDRDPSHEMDEKKYHKAIDIAASPLSILNKVKDGSITPEELGHFTQMFPEMHSHLSKEMTKKISKQQIDEEQPHYKTRQGLSMFLGAPLDSSFTPANIMAAQNVFIQNRAAKSAAASGQGKTKKGTAKLGETSKQFLTADQAASNRQTSES